MAKKNNEVIQILMDRDDMTFDDARKRYLEVRKEVQEVLADDGGYDDVEDIIMGELGLEMDYIFDFI